MAKRVVLFCALMLPALKCHADLMRDFSSRNGDFYRLKAILTADDNHIIEARGKCYRDFPVTTFHLFAKFAWRLENPTADCFLKCILRGLSYMDENGVIKKDLLKEKIQSNTDGRTRELLTENIDYCCKDSAKSRDLCEKSFNFLHCFYRSSLLTSLIQSLELFKYAY